MHIHPIARKCNHAGSSRCTRSWSNCMTSWNSALRTSGTEQHLLTQRGDLLAQLCLDAATRAGRAWAIRPLLTASGGPHRPVPRVTSPQALLFCPCTLAAHALERAEAPQTALPVVASVLSWDGGRAVVLQANRRCGSALYQNVVIFWQRCSCRAPSSSSALLMLTDLTDVTDLPCITFPCPRTD